MEFYNMQDMESKNNEVMILAAIADVKLELQRLKVNGTKEQQLECFKRLINLFSSLNVEKLIKDQQNLL